MSDRVVDFANALNRLLFAVHPCDMAVVTSSSVEEASALIASVAAGDEMAFASLVRLHHEDMRRVCVVVANDDRLAENAVAAAWSIAWRKLGGLRDPARLRPWLVRSAERPCLCHRPSPSGAVASHGEDVR